LSIYLGQVRHPPSLSAHAGTGRCHFLKSSSRSNISNETNPMFDTATRQAK
jgi:hypothetical protein